jgi:NAD(P)H-dependent FMN reductase
MKDSAIPFQLFTACFNMSVAIVVGSTRKPRIGLLVAQWVKTVIEEEGRSRNTRISMVDIASFNLPVFDEPLSPAMVPQYGTHVNSHSKAWSVEMSKHDGYIFVIPEYNGGLAGGTKNAIDYLYNEWQGKPFMIVSYGIKGAVWAADQLKHTLTVMKLRPVQTIASLPFSGGGTGQSLMDAVQGKLNEESVELWRKSHSADVVTAFSELVTLLNESDKP